MRLKGVVASRDLLTLCQMPRRPQVGRVGCKAICDGAAAKLRRVDGGWANAAKLRRPPSILLAVAVGWRVEAPDGTGEVGGRRRLPGIRYRILEHGKAQADLHAVYARPPYRLRSNNRPGGLPSSRTTQNERIRRPAGQTTSTVGCLKQRQGPAEGAQPALQTKLVASPTVHPPPKYFPPLKEAERGHSAGEFKRYFLCECGEGLVKGTKTNHCGRRGEMACIAAALLQPDSSPHACPSYSTEASRPFSSMALQRSRALRDHHDCVVGTGAPFAA